MLNILEMRRKVRLVANCLISHVGSLLNFTIELKIIAREECIIDKLYVFNCFSLELGRMIVSIVITINHPLFYFQSQIPLQNRLVEINFNSGTPVVW